MKQQRVFLIVFLLALIGNVKAQRYELGLQLGGSNIVGDIGRTNYIYPFPAKDISTFGVPVYANLLFKLNFNPYQSLRFNLGYSNFYFSDGFATENYRRLRRNYYGQYYQGRNNITEAQVLFEYNFAPINNEQKDGLLSPYIFGGLGAMLYNQPTLTVNNTFTRDPLGNPAPPMTNTDFNTTYLEGTKKGMTLAIPFGVGLKYKFDYNWTIFGEFMFRATFADDLDYSKLSSKNVRVTYEKVNSSESPNPFADPSNQRKSLLQSDPYLKEANDRTNTYLENRTIGNTKSNDWINTISIGLTYSFGRPPCYCDQ